MSTKATHSKLSSQEDDEDYDNTQEDLETNNSSSQFEIEVGEKPPRVLSPGERNLGEGIAFFFKNGNPVFTIGPHCNAYHI